MMCAVAMVLATSLAQAQVAEPADQPEPAAAPAATDPLEVDAEPEPELGWDDYSIKAYTVQIFGGSFKGARYLELPVKPDRTQVELGSDRVMSFDGTWWEPDELDYNIYDAPIKTIEDGFTVGMRLGCYLAEQFHMDLSVSYSSSEAVLTMMNLQDPENPFREEIDRDSSVQIFRGGLSMMYDFTRFQAFGIHPSLGFGFGGVINRFSNLEDVSGLYLVGTASLQRRLFGTASAFLEYDLTAFSMSRDELHYTKSVTYSDIVVGVSFFLDTVPAEVRALHESERAESRRR